MKHNNAIRKKCIRKISENVILVKFESFISFLFLISIVITFPHIIYRYFTEYEVNTK